MGFESPQIKKEALPCGNASFLVRPKGFEPLIFRFVAEHSIQLSYGRIFIFFTTRKLLYHTNYKKANTF